jgi:hypothetical protein
LLTSERTLVNKGTRASGRNSKRRRARETVSKSHTSLSPTAKKRSAFL